MIVYYTIKPVISLNMEIRIEYTKDDVQNTEDFSEPFTLAFGNPIDALEKRLEKRFGESVQMIPSEFQKKLDTFMDDPANWPSEDGGSCPYCGK